MKMKHIGLLLAVILVILLMIGGAYADSCRYTADSQSCSYWAIAGGINHYAKNECLRTPPSSTCAWRPGFAGYGCYDQRCAGSNRPDPEVDGGWSSWYDSGSCTQVCDGGTKSQIRYCNNPSPSNGGDYCSGSSTQTASCNTQQCTLSAPSAIMSLNLAGEYVLSWTSGSAQRYGVDDYSVYENVNDGAFVPINTTTGTTYTLPSAPLADTNYDYYVTMTSNEPLTVASNTVELDGPSGPLAGDTTPPIPPVLETLSPLNDGNFMLNWTANPGSDPDSGIADYRVFADYNYGAFSEIADVNLNTTHTVVNNLPPGIYGYYLVVYNGDGLSSTSNAIYTTTVDINGGVVPDTTAPIAPIIDALPTYNDGNFDLNWGANPGSDSDSNIWQYIVWSNFNGGTFTSLTNNDLNTFYEVRNNSPDGNYGYFVQIFNEYGLDSNSNAVYSDTNVFATDSTPPVAPILDSLPFVNDGNFDLNWTNNPGSDPESGIVNYQVWSNYSGGAFTQLVDANLNTAHSIVSNSPDGNYGYFIQAFNGRGMDVNSGIIYTFTDSNSLVAPTLAPIPPYNAGDFDLDWSLNPGQDPGFGISGYVIWGSFDSAPYTVLGTTAGSVFSVGGSQPTDGNYAYFIQMLGNSGRDANSNIVSSIMDTNVPDVNIVNPGIVWQTSDYNVDFDVDFGLSGQNIAQVQIDGNGWINLPADFNLLITIDGNHQIDYNFVDNSMNETSGTIYSARDATAPIVTIVNPGNPWANSFYNVDFIVNFDVSGEAVSQYQINGAGWNNFAFDYNVAITVDGNHQVDYNFVDIAGNITTGTIYTGLDASAPTIGSIINPGATWQTTDFNIEFVGMDFNISGQNSAQYRIDGGAWTPFAIDFNIPITTDGNHVVDYNFVDNAGNETSGTLNTLLDTQAPSISVLNAGLPWNNTDFNVDYIVDFSVSGEAVAQYNIDGAGWTNFLTDYNAPITTDGIHSVDVNFCNGAGSCNGLVVLAYLDKTAPSVTITNPGATWYAGDFNVSFTDINFDVSGLLLAQYRVNGGGWQNITGDFNIPITTDGNHSIEYYLADSATNVTSGTIYALRDTNSVGVIIINPGAGWTNVDYNVDFVVSFGVSGQTIAQYQIDGAGWNNFATDFNVPFTIDNGYNLDYNFCNGAGNCAAGTMFTGLDQTGPTIGSIVNPGASVSVPGDFNVDFVDVNFDLSGRANAEYQIDVGGWVPFATDFNVPIITDGNHQVDYRFTDNAGNITSGTEWAERDTGAVSVSIINPGAVWATALYNVEFIVDFGGSGQAVAQYNLDGAGWGAFLTDFNVPINTDAIHTLDYNFCNVAGDCSTGTLNTNLDSVAPSTTITPSGWQNVAFNATLTCSDATSGCATTTYRLDTNAESDVNYGGWNTYAGPIAIAGDGNYAIDYNSVDVAGNVETIQTAYLLLDSALPTMDANYPTVAVNNGNGNVDVIAAATDPLSGILGYWYSIIAGVWNWSTNPTYTFNSMPNGDYNVSVIVTDNADNNSATSVVAATVNVPPADPPTGSGDTSSGGTTYYHNVTPPTEDAHTVDDQTETDDTSTTDVVEGTGEDIIEFMPGDLIISEARPQISPTGLFGLGESGAIIVPALLLLILIAAIAIFLTKTETGQGIIKGSK